jgi:hypothetical protein
VEEVQARLKNIPRNIIVVYPYDVQQSIYPDNPHFLLRVTSRESKKSWAIDITGAQFGFTQQLRSWDEYFNECIEKVEVVSELSTSRTLLKAFSLVQGAPSVDFGNLAIKAWEEIELDRRIFVLLHDENFPVAQAGLLETIKDTTRKFVDESDHSKEVQEAVDYEQKNPNASREKLLQLHLMLSSSIHSEPKNKNCSSCGEPAVNRCSQCRVSVYCNAKCQTTHWIKHRKSCKTKNLDKVMHRAAALLQKIYLVFRRTTFRDQFTKIEDSGRHLIIHLKSSAVKDSIFTPFPDHLIPTEKDKEMILCASRCSNFVGHFKTVIEMVLEGNS